MNGKVCKHTTFSNSILLFALCNLLKSLIFTHYCIPQGAVKLVFPFYLPSSHNSTLPSVPARKYIQHNNSPTIQQLSCGNICEIKQEKIHICCMNLCTGIIGMPEHQRKVGEPSALKCYTKYFLLWKSKGMSTLKIVL